MQIEPGPIPTLTASAPAFAKALAAAAVAIFPAITCNFGKAFLTIFKVSITPLEWPCAVSIAITSTPALTSALTRSKVSVVTPTAAPTLRRPCSSLHA